MEEPAAAAVVVDDMVAVTELVAAASTFAILAKLEIVAIVVSFVD